VCCGWVCISCTTSNSAHTPGEPHVSATVKTLYTVPNHGNKTVVRAHTAVAFCLNCHPYYPGEGAVFPTVRVCCGVRVLRVRMWVCVGVARVCVCACACLCVRCAGMSCTPDGTCVLWCVGGCCSGGCVWGLRACACVCVCVCVCVYALRWDDGRKGVTHTHRVPFRQVTGSLVHDADANETVSEWRTRGTSLHASLFAENAVCNDEATDNNEATDGA
jgi:hypothetical protein